MDALRDGIYTHLTGDATFAGLNTGGLWFTEAPLEPGGSALTMPYTTFSFISIIPLWGMGASGPKQRTEDARVQFSMFSRSAASDEVIALYKALRARMDDASFSVTGYSLIRCVRDGHNPMRDDAYWHYQTDYLIRIEAT